MKLQYFRGDQPNFGDELNPWIWPQLLPGFFDESPDELFIGIGSIIGAPYAPSAKKIVAGAGYVQSYHSQVPDVHGADWDVFFVRGPRTAHLLGVPENLGIGDAATLLRALDRKFYREPRYIGFIPHWESMQRGNWKVACELAGIRLIDPRTPVERVIAEILGCEMLIAEAMHGAIVADTLRVPWLPVLPIDGAHRSKWLDWADTLGLKLRQRRLWPSSLGEGLKLHQNRLGPSGPAATGTMYRPSIARQTVSQLAKPFIAYVAAQRLSFLAKRDPCLSPESVTDNTVNKMLENIRNLERKYKKAG